jgi:protein-S-isoprenylcysteine O-methyltransferase Ste14
MALRDELVKQGDFLFRWRTYVPLLIVPVALAALREGQALEPVVGGRIVPYWRLMSAAVALLGLAIRWVVGGHAPANTSGRNTEQQVAASLNTTGMYSLVRHPLYLGNFLCTLGVALITQVWWFVVICCLAFGLYYERIVLAEERFLAQRFGEAFERWASATPCWLPRLPQWRRPSLPFSGKTALRREFSGFFLLVASFELVTVLGDGLAHNRWALDTSTKLVLGLGLLAYAVLAVLKKKTGVFHVEGR